jgi:PIN domain nuclease of toxin-antitoxin system
MYRPHPGPPSKAGLILPMTVEVDRTRSGKTELTLLGLTQPRTAIDSCRLPSTFHADPAGRLLVVTARSENAALVTRDRKILDHASAGHVRGLAA